jgi:hypothetical protein
MRLNLFRFLNWYGMFRPFRAKQNGIDNLEFHTILEAYEDHYGSQKNSTAISYDTQGYGASVWVARLAN